MKRPFLVLALLLATLPGLAQKINDVDVTVRLRKDGTASVTQIWDVEIVSGTEWYIPIGNLGRMEIDSLRVFEGEREFDSDGRSWNSDRSREEKAFRCGIVEKGSGGVELCWGQGEYGAHVWTATFVVRGLVQSLSDYDGFNFMFVNDELVAGPCHAKVTILNETGSEPWSAENAGIWSFGYTGTILFVDGTIVAESTESLGYSDCVIVMCRFDKGLFEPVVSRDMTFEEMKKKAFKGSNYVDPVTQKIVDWTLGLSCGLLCFGVPLYFILLFLWRALLRATGHIWKKSVFGTTKVRGWWRDLPLHRDLTAAYALLTAGNRISKKYDANLIGAYFLQWIQEGYIKVQRDPKNDQRVNLAFDPSDDLILPDSVQVELYNMALEAAGKNHLLESNEFEKWARSHYGKAAAWPQKAASCGDVVWKRASREERRHLLQFKNYLEDFTLSKERQAIEVKLWRSYLVYAQLFGIADKVAENFRKLYPDDFKRYVDQIGVRDAATLTHVLSSTQSTARTMLNYAASAKRSASLQSSGSGHSSGGWSRSGGGGWSSHGGGGGYSGGGHGGGSR